MPLIEISIYPGKTKEKKEAFAKAITNAAVEKTKPAHIIIIYDERSRENCYISGEPLYAGSVACYRFLITQVQNLAIL